MVASIIRSPGEVHIHTQAFGQRGSPHKLDLNSEHIDRKLVDHLMIGAKDLLNILCVIEC